MSDSEEVDGRDVSGVVTELADLVGRLRNEVETMRQAVDELRDEVTYELRKLRDELTEPAPPYRLTSMTSDPLAADFPKRLNAVDASVFDCAAATVESLLRRFMGDSPTEQLSTEQWEEDQELSPGTVIEIDEAIFGWFAEYLVTVQEGDNWFVTDNGLGDFHLLWSATGGRFVRRLTDEEQQAFTGLTGIAPEVDPDDTQEAHLQADTESVSSATSRQQLFW